MAVAPDTRGSNFYREDRALRLLLPLYLGDELANFLAPYLDSLGERAANDLDGHAMLANSHPPVLHPRDRFGRDRDWIEYHPSYRVLERVAFDEFQIHAMSHRSGIFGWKEPMPLVAKHAFTYLFNQAEFGLGCPINVTDSAAHLIRKFGSKEVQEQFLPRMLESSGSDHWQGAQFITEHEGGSDVGTISTRAERRSGKWLIYGEKWFCSNADADVVTLLARPSGAPAGTRGLGLFVVPRTLSTGERNNYRIIRLKDKLGTRSMASGEIRFEGAEAFQLGELGEGFRHMAEMINWSRLSNGVKSAALMRRAVHDARVVAHTREVFGNRIANLPLGKRQLLKLALPAEQALSMWMFVASVLDAAVNTNTDSSDSLAKCARLATPVLKMRATRDARAVTADAMEMRGGCGYIEEFVNPRLVRDALLGSIWEGTTNIIAIDVVRRAIQRNDCLDAFADLLKQKIEQLSIVDARYSRELMRWLDRCSEFARQVARNEEEELYRQVATALYHVSTAILMAWEAQETRHGERLLWSRLVVDHRLADHSPVLPKKAAAKVVDLLVGQEEITVNRANELLRGAT